MWEVDLLGAGHLSFLDKQEQVYNLFIFCSDANQTFISTLMPYFPSSLWPVNAHTFLVIPVLLSFSQIACSPFCCTRARYKQNVGADPLYLINPDILTTLTAAGHLFSYGFNVGKATNHA
jgi:hypothetical protein